MGRTLEQLPDAVRQAFTGFALNANRQSLHPLDWERFYEFTYLCYRRRVKLTIWDVRELLENAGVADSYALEIALVYQHCRDLLKYVRSRPVSVKSAAGRAKG